MTDVQTKPQPVRSKPPADESVKETFESIIIAFILAFVFRAYVVEAFVIPTGSMAPTLLGAHLQVQCDQCGYTYATDVPHPRQNPEYATCPMCRYPNPIGPAPRPRSGDRILVQKYIYSVSEPRRWDVVVFKFPDDPQTNYIKRLVGLPNESLVIFDGNIYARPTDAQGRFTQAWQIARKTDRPDVQRAVWQPIYHSQYIPLDGGDGPLRQTPRHNAVWSPPWVPQTADDDWQIADRRSYRYAGDQPSQIRFDFQLAGDATSDPAGQYPYSQFSNPASLEFIEDIRLAVAFQPDRPGLRASLSTTVRLNSADLDAGPQTLTAALDDQGLLRLTAHRADTDAQTEELARAQLDPMPPGTVTEMELWFVDQEASVWVGGERVLVWQFDVPMEAILENPALRPPPPPRPTVAIEVAGSPVTLHRVELDRDLFYSVLNSNEQVAQRAALLRRYPEAAGPLELRADEFFCLGDNGPWSEDGRYWTGVDPWVQQRFFHGEPRPGIVPRQLMMGRAFFVYFPAPYPWKAGAPGIFPNFGDMRFIH